MPFQISGPLLTRNWILNLGGQVLPSVAGLFAIPFLLRGMGGERFGILSIVWVLLGSSAVFDLGLGRATTKSIAESLGRSEAALVPELLWSALAIQVGFGVIAGASAALAVPFLVARLLRVPPALSADTRLSFFLLAASLPLLLAASSLRGALEAAQRFDLVNAVKIPLSVSVFVLPALGMLLGLRLPGLVGILTLAWLLAALAYWLACRQCFPALGRRFAVRREVVQPLLAYGGWVQISNLLTPLLCYLDRFFIGSLVSVAAVGYYTAPFDAIVRASILPVSLTSTLFPAFSAMNTPDSRRRIEDLYVRSLKSILLLLGPALLLVGVFAHSILQLWLGGAFAARSTRVLQILAAGVAINSMAVLPFSLLQGLGRADLTAKFHLLELPVCVGVLWLLVARLGIEGAALAWTARVALDAVLLYSAVLWLKIISFARLAGNGIRRTGVVLLAFAALSFAPRWAGESMLVQILVVGLLLPAFGFIAWGYVLDERDRSLVGAVAGQAWTAFARVAAR